MPLTKAFKETIVTRIESDPAFADALLEEGLQALLDDDIDVGKATLRNYINGTVGFEQLAIDMDINAKSLMRMFSASGNPTVSNLFTVLSWLQHYRGITLEVRIAQ